MNTYISKLQKHHWVGLSFLIASLIGVFVLFSPKVTAAGDGERLVSIYENGTEQTIITKATTVREALERAKVGIGEHDAVEPGLDTQLVASTYNVNIYRARPVTIVDGATRIKTISPYQSAKQIAESAQIQTYPEDNLAITRVDDFVGESTIGLKVSIDRATPLTLVLYGDHVAARTQATTVGEMLAAKNVKLEPQDGVSVPLTTPIAAGMTVNVWRNGVQTVTREEPVAFLVERIQDVDREAGYKLVKTPGKPGKKSVTYEVNTQNGKEVSKREIQSVVTEAASKQVEVVGARPGFSGSFGEALAKLRACEAGGRYDRNSGNGYYGAYQFNIGTWANYGGYHVPSDAPGAVQDQKAWETYQRRGWQPWPGCTKKLGLQDIYR
jgi:uncharacterized protein YabE (DUF348 family)